MADKYLELKQDGKTYNLYDMPAGFVIKGDLVLTGKNLTELPDLSKVKVEGDFMCSFNSLTSLKGSPQEVGGNFFCINNKLTDLEGAPAVVGNDFLCSNNSLTSLKGAPRIIVGDFFCEYNKLTTLEGGPQNVGGRFWCRFNNDLESLVGLPVMAGTSSRIHCNDELYEKYGFSAHMQGTGIEYGELVKSPLFQSELHKSMIYQKKKEQEQALQAKHKAGFAAFKKKFKPAEREE